MKNGDQQYDAVPAAELVRAFPQCRDRAAKGALLITNHGRATNVLLTIEQFEALVAQGGAAPVEAGGGMRELAEWLDDAMIICDRDMRIEFANRVAHAVCRKSLGSMNGRPMIEVLPEIAGTMIEVHLRRTQISSEPSSADLPSPFAAGAWLRAHTFPIGNHVAFVFRDISDEVQRHHLADVKNALLDAMNAHHEIGYVRVSVRGMIERVDLPFCEMLDLPEQRLINLPLADLVPVRSRAAFRSALDEVIRANASQRIETEFLANNGENISMTVAIAPLHGAYGAEGAVLLMTRTDGAD